MTARACLVVVWMLLQNAAHAAEPPITALAYAPDGETLVSGSQAGIRLWRAADLLPLGALDVDLPTVHDLAFSPDGQRLAVAGGTPGESGVICLVAWPEGKTLARLEDHTDVVYDVDWSLDGTRLVSGSLDRRVLAWDTESAAVVREFTGHSKGVTAVCLLGDFGLLVSAGLDQSLRVWDAATGKLVRTLDNHTAPVNHLALRNAAGGLPLISSAGEDRTLRFWQPTIGRMVRFARLDTVPLTAAWLPDRMLIAAATTDGRLLLVDAETTEILRELPVAEDDWIYSLAVSPDRRSAVVGTRRGTLHRATWELP